jgi:hypothetical protein
MKRLSITGAAAVAALSLAACSRPSPAGGASATGSGSAEEAHAEFGKMSVDELQAKMDEAKAGKAKLFVYDNNDAKHYADGHIPGAKWVKFNEVKASDLPPEKDATLVFYCANEH